MRRPRAMVLGVAFLAFVSLGLPDGVLGIAWPSVRRAFDLPLSQLGVLLAAAMLGYLVSAFSSGQIVARIGVGRLLLWSSATVVLSLLAYALAPAWPVMLAGGVLTGLGAGAIDAGVNTFAAARLWPRQVNWLHACYGVGATLGPLLMTSVLSAGWGWRWGYGVIAALLAAMTACFLVTLDLWEVTEDARTAGGETVADVGVRAALRHPPAWIHVALFFVYTGLEVTAGQWSYSLLTESRGVPMGVAGVAVGAYWASLTLGRLVFGALAKTWPAQTLLRASMSGVPVAALVIWLAPGPFAGVIGLAALGFVLAPIYPLLISLTPARMGAGYATHVIGFQVAAAYLGAAALPGAAGVLARGAGLEVVGPIMLVASLAVIALHEVAVRQASERSVRPGVRAAQGA